MTGDNPAIPHNLHKMKLLKQLYEIYSPSGSEKRMKKFIKFWINRNVPDAVIEHDNTGNLYITRGKAQTYPCVVAHLDQIQKTHSLDFKAVETNEIIFGYSSKNRRQEGLGADDKNGIWVALKCLKKYDVLKVALFVGEEVGCVGSGQCVMHFFDDCRFVLQCDRKHGKDLIINASWSELCSEEFLKDIDYEKFGYKTENGMLTDVATLKDEGLAVSCLNLSCGYYEPHTDHEFTIKAELWNCLALVEHIIENCTNTYPHKDDGYGLYGKYYGRSIEEYDMACDMVEDYLSYNPNATADEVYDIFKHDFHLDKEDFKDIVKSCNLRCL